MAKSCVVMDKTRLLMNALGTFICLFSIKLGVCRQLSPELPQSRQDRFFAGFLPYLKGSFIRDHHFDFVAFWQLQRFDH